MKSFTDVELVIQSVSSNLSSLATTSLDDNRLKDIVRDWLPISFLNLLQSKRPTSRIVYKTVNVVGAFVEAPDDFWLMVDNVIEGDIPVSVRGNDLSIAAVDGSYDIEYYSSIGLEKDNIVISGIALQIFLLAHSILSADDAVALSQRRRQWSSLALG